MDPKPKPTVAVIRNRGDDALHLDASFADEADALERANALVADGYTVFIVPLYQPQEEPTP